MTATHDTAVESPPTTFSADTAGLDDCVATTFVDLAPGDVFDLRIAPVLIPRLGARIDVYCNGKCDSSRIAPGVQGP